VAQAVVEQAAAQVAELVVAELVVEMQHHHLMTISRATKGSSSNRPRPMSLKTQQRS